jgi:L-tryptophan--pyruvate aminotransferase
MAKITGVFSMRHFFVLSLALNVSFILRTMYEREQGLICFRSDTQKGQITQRTRLSSSSSSSSSSAAATRTEAQDGVERVINLDQ